MPACNLTPPANEASGSTQNSIDRKPHITFMKIKVLHLLHMSSISAIVCAPKYYHLINPIKLWLWNHLPRDAHKSRKTWSIMQSLSTQAIFCTWHTGCFLWQSTQALVSPNDFLSFTLFSLCACSFLTVHHHEGRSEMLCFCWGSRTTESHHFFSLFTLPTPFSTSGRGSQAKKKLFCEFDHSDSIVFLGVCQSSRPKAQSES